MRGDVKLYACFGAHATACAHTGADGGNTPGNQIEGVIDNFEAFVGGVWRATESDGTAPDDAFHIGRVNLVSTPIEADGAFGLGVGITNISTVPVGQVTTDSASAERFGDETRGLGIDLDNLRWQGSWGGRFYGPATDADGPAETAGWWVLPGDDNNFMVHTVVGSFGAARD